MCQEGDHPSRSHRVGPYLHEGDERESTEGERGLTGGAGDEDDNRAVALLNPDGWRSCGCLGRVPARRDRAGREKREDARDCDAVEGEGRCLREPAAVMGARDAS
jgi:hypothetical protein